MKKIEDLPVEIFKRGLIARLEKANSWKDIDKIFEDLARGFKLLTEKLGEEEENGDE